MLCTDNPNVLPFLEKERDAEIWFDDGNVVIVAGNTAFRLYKGLLTSVSPVFKDLFSVPQPKVGETMDGCPMVHLSDSPTDLRHFLRVASKPYLHVVREGVLSFSMLAAITRIAHKYQAEDVVDIARRHLEKFFNASEVLHTAKLCLTGSWEEVWEEHQTRCSLRVEMKDAFEAVSLARLLDCQQMLPFAFFLCCAGDPLHLRNGVRREDGVIECLSEADYLLCLRALPALKRGCHESVRYGSNPFDPRTTNISRGFGKHDLCGALYRLFS